MFLTSNRFAYIVPEMITNDTTSVARIARRGRRDKGRETENKQRV